MFISIDNGGVSSNVTSLAVRLVTATQLEILTLSGQTGHCCSVGDNYSKMFISVANGGVSSNVTCLAVRRLVIAALLVARCISRSLIAVSCNVTGLTDRQTDRPLAALRSALGPRPNGSEYFTQSGFIFNRLRSSAFLLRNHQRVQLAATNRMDWLARRCHTTAAAARHGWRIVADKLLRYHN
ncbi:hypothetical protein J6590_062332 [Homalodisca vitripennis]|nr:hypothetical protein J6590_062332 [Homalodisca vitripennis]